MTDNPPFDSGPCTECGKDIKYNYFTDEQGQKFHIPCAPAAEVGAGTVVDDWRYGART